MIKRKKHNFEVRCKKEDGLRLCRLSTEMERKKMDQETRWMTKYNEVKTFIETNKRNPSKYDAIERGLYCNWIRHNRKLLKAEQLKEDRAELFEKLLAKMEEYKRVNQYA